MVEMMVAMTSARTTRTSAINIKTNAMRNITKRNAQRPVANVEEMMVEMMVAMTSARTTRTSAINIKTNAMRNITKRNAQRPVANVEEMMAEMVTARTPGTNVKKIRRNVIRIYSKEMHENL